MVSPNSSISSDVVDDDNVEAIIDRMEQTAHVTLKPLSEFKLNIDLVVKLILDYAGPNVESHQRNMQILNAWDSIRSSNDVDAIRAMRDEIENLFAEEADFLESLTGDSLEERQKNLKKGDIPALRASCELFTDGGGKKMKRAIRGFVEDLLVLCVLNREKVQAFQFPTIQASENPSVEAKRKSTASTGSQPPQKRRITETAQKTKGKPPRPTKKPRRISNDSVKSNQSTNKSKKKSPKSCNLKSVDTNVNDEEAAKERLILEHGTERQKAKLQAEKEKNSKNEEEKWLESNITRMLGQEGWRWVEAGKTNHLDTWYFLRPGCASTEEGVLGKDYFRDAKEIVKYFKETNQYTKYTEKLRGGGQVVNKRVGGTDNGHDGVESSGRGASTNGEGRQAPVLVNISGNVPAPRTPPTKTSGMSPEGFRLSEVRVQKENQVSSPLVATDLYAGNDENMNPRHQFSPEMQGIRNQLEEAKTTSKKERDRIESAGKAAERVGAKKEARRRLEEEFRTRSVTFQKTSSHTVTAVPVASMNDDQQDPS